LLAKVPSIEVEYTRNEVPLESILLIGLYDELIGGSQAHMEA